MSDALFRKILHPATHGCSAYSTLLRAFRQNLKKARMFEKELRSVRPSLKLNEDYIRLIRALEQKK